ncbi:hypothetical protein AMJ82_01055 [candidate division TA06 bacterium SM23_40]|uniref:Uncharacterized protein n=1 Tax=candidate division TA06 bacterium SM23_40 TaxID=1703774 RepID=A0A0S8GI77_UNCT6|nr:MAG: hypothetical protein AMJ82_01055 [candidate division TA06 bacterium SM23_40]
MMQRVSVRLAYMMSLAAGLIFASGWMMQVAARSCQGESWTTYTNANFVEDIVDVDDRLWCATGGGVAR